MTLGLPRHFHCAESGTIFRLLCHSRSLRRFFPDRFAKREKKLSIELSFRQHKSCFRKCVSFALRLLYVVTPSAAISPPRSTRSFSFLAFVCASVARPDSSWECFPVPVIYPQSSLRSREPLWDGAKESLGRLHALAGGWLLRSE